MLEIITFIYDAEVDRVQSLGHQGLTSRPAGMLAGAITLINENDCTNVTIITNNYVMNIY